MEGRRTACIREGIKSGEGGGVRRRGKKGKRDGGLTYTLQHSGENLKRGRGRVRGRGRKDGDFGIGRETYGLHSGEN